MFQLNNIWHSPHDCNSKFLVLDNFHGDFFGFIMTIYSKSSQKHDKYYKNVIF